MRTWLTGKSRIAAARRNARGFSLLEMVAVVAILALASTLAVISLKAVQRGATLDQVVASLCARDADLRDYARRFGRPLHVSLEARTMKATEASGDSSHRGEGQAGRPPGPFTVPPSYRLEAIRPERIETDAGQPGWRISSDGRSRGYAIRVIGPNASRTVLFSGLTGQSVVYETTDPPKQALATLR